MPEFDWGTKGENLNSLYVFYYLLGINGNKW